MGGLNKEVPSLIALAIWPPRILCRVDSADVKLCMYITHGICLHINESVKAMLTTMVVCDFVFMQHDLS